VAGKRKRPAGSKKSRSGGGNAPYKEMMELETIAAGALALHCSDACENVIIGPCNQAAAIGKPVLSGNFFSAAFSGSVFAEQHDQSGRP
jgi:hypothetical protein